MAEPDFSFWDTFDEFTLNQAAYLWCGMEPEIKVGGHDAKVLAINNRLYDATQTGSLPYRDTSRTKYVSDKWEAYAPGSGRTINYPGEIYISRANLKAWAVRNGMKPKFLFPEERHSEEIQDMDWRRKALIASGAAFANSEDNANTSPPFMNEEEKPLDTRERETLLAIIAALCELAGITSDKRGLAGELSKITERLGIRKSDDRIRTYLQQAATLIHK